MGRGGGFALSEALIAMGITSLLLLALCAFSMFSSRSFAAMFNYVDLDDANRLAMDQLTTDIRQCNAVTVCTANNLTLSDSSGTITYTYDAAARTLVRTKNGAEAKTLLKGCDTLTFAIGQRNVETGSYEVFPATDAAHAKVVNIAWVCSRSLFGNKENTESVQTARIVIRKQGT